MSEPIDQRVAPGDSRRTWEDRLAGPLFFLALMFLVVLAGLIHRYPRLDPDHWEVYLISGALGVLWVVFLLEAVRRFACRPRGQSAWTALAGAVACGLLPPLRMGCRSQVRPNHIW